MLMLNTMGCAAILRRRWISGIFAAAKRTLTSASGGVKSPWLMLRSDNDSEGGTILRFWCCAKNKIYSFYDNRHIHMRRGRGGMNDIEIEIEYEYVAHGYYKSVGSSQGWLAYQVKRNLYLIDVDFRGSEGSRGNQTGTRSAAQFHLPRRIGYDHYYIGISDYRNDDFSTPMPLDVPAGNPLWFTPRRHN